MSTDWDIACRSHLRDGYAARMGLNECRSPEALAVFLSGRDGFAAAGRALVAIRGEYIYELECDGSSGMKRICHFFADHAGCDLYVRSEYGEEYGKCGQGYNCVCGGYRHCNQAKGHEGAHAHV